MIRKENSKAGINLFYWMLYLLLASILATPMFSLDGAKDNGAGTKIIIFHLNDIHASIDNFAKISYLVNKERANTPNVFLLSAGDTFSGNPFVDQYEPKGEPLLALMNKLRFDVAVLGNHDFDYGQEILRNFITRASFPIICANIKVTNGSIPQPNPYIFIKTQNGIQIAILGVIQIEKESKIPSVLPERVKGMIFEDGVSTVQQYRFLKDKSDICLALTHLGVEKDEQLAKKTDFIDIIVGGHSHTVIAKPFVVNGVLITQAGSSLQYLGKIELEVKNRRIIRKESKLIALQAIAEEDKSVKAMIEEYHKNPVLSRQITNLEVPLEGKIELGCMVTDAIRETMDLDIVLYNSGGLRIGRLGEDVKLKDIYALHPFGNYVVKLMMDIKEVRGLIAYDFERHRTPDLQVSGMEYTVFHTADNKVHRIEIKNSLGFPFDENKKYRVGLTNYVLSSYPFAHSDPGQSLETKVVDIVIKYLENGIDARKYKGLVRSHEYTIRSENMSPMGKTLVEISSGDHPFAGSNPAGNLITDAIRWHTGVDVVLFPSRLLKKKFTVKAGEHLYDYMLYNLYQYIEQNRVVTGSIPGKILSKFILRRTQYKNRTDLQVSGIQYHNRRGKEGTIHTISCFTHPNEKIKPEQVYNVAFIAYDYNKYYHLSDQVKNLQLHQESVLFMAQRYIQKKGTIGKEILENRIKFLNEE